MLWLGVAYLGALAALFITSLWTVNEFTGAVERDLDPATTSASCSTTEVYRTVTLRTLRHRRQRHRDRRAAGASRSRFYMAKVASPRAQRLLVIAVLTPLWARYLVKAYAWRAMFSATGPIAWVLAPFGLSSPGYGLTATVITLSYLWLPYMILPMYAGLERVPNSLLEASADLGAGTCRDAAPDRAAGAVPRDRRRLDLHLLALARRLHRREDRRRHEPDARQRRLRRRS